MQSRAISQIRVTVVQRERDSDRSDIHQAGIPRSESRAAGSREGVCKREDIFRLAVESPSASSYGSLPLVCDYLRSGSTPMSIMVIVSPLKALMLDQVTCKHHLQTGPGISCVLGCPTSCVIGPKQQ